MEQDKVRAKAIIEILGKPKEHVQTAINLVVKRVEIDYQRPLKSGDKFVSKLRMERLSPLRFGFVQHIYRLPDNKLMIKALVTGTAINERGRPELPQELIEVWGLE